MLEFDKVSGTGKGFGLKEVSFSLPPGYIMGLIGKNGAGKTTLLHYILGDYEYTGNIRVCGQECREMHADCYNEVAFVSEENDFFWERDAITNGDILGTLYENWQPDAFFHMLREWKVPWRNCLRNLSRGEFIKFQMAFAMAHGTKLYLLDEVTAGMDPVFRMDFYQILRELVKEETASILMTTHLVEECGRSMDYIGEMEAGRLVSFRENFGEMVDE